MGNGDSSVVIQRTLVALVLIPITVFCVLRGGLPLVFLALAFLMTGLTEFSKMISGKTFGIHQALMYLAGLAFITFAYLDLRIAFSAITLALVASLMVTEIFTGHIEGSVNRIALFTLGALYVGLPLAHLALVRGLPGDIGLYGVLFILITTWATDSTAFFVGRSFGKTKLTKVSPSKSVEGAIGGFLGALAFGLLFKGPLGISLMSCLALSAVTSIASQLGDLAESLIKRDVGVKDSGHVLPGHGGVLDRIDSILFSAPFVYWMLSTIMS